MLTDNLKLWDLSAIPKSKCKLKGTPVLGDLTSKYKNLPVKFNPFNKLLGCGRVIKLFADMLPWIDIAFLPISFAYKSYFRRLIEKMYYKNFWNFSLFFVLLPISSWHYFEVFENVHIGMLPKSLRRGRLLWFIVT